MTDIVERLRGLCLHDVSGYCDCTAQQAADEIESLRAQLKAQGEPVAWMVDVGDAVCFQYWPHPNYKSTPLYTHPPKPESVEPVAWVLINSDGECEQIDYCKESPLPDDDGFKPLYLHPPKPSNA